MAIVMVRMMAEATRWDNGIITQRSAEDFSVLLLSQ